MVKIDGQFYDIPNAVRCWQKFDHNTRADRASNFRFTQGRRDRLGEFYYLHPLVPNRAFPTRKAALQAALATFGED